MAQQQPQQPSVEHGREPCPDRILDDIGGAFGMGALGGGFWHTYRGLKNSPRGYKLVGTLEVCLFVLSLERWLVQMIDRLHVLGAARRRAEGGRCRGSTSRRRYRHCKPPSWLRDVPRTPDSHPSPSTQTHTQTKPTPDDPPRVAQDRRQLCQLGHDVFGL